MFAFWVFTFCAAFDTTQANADIPTNWVKAKNLAQDKVYKNGAAKGTFYCGCPYTSDRDNDGSGTVNLNDCGMQPLPLKAAKAKVIEWEHIVPASLMPAREHACWSQSEQFSQCVSASGRFTKKRNCCVRVKDTFRDMTFDLHNLAPAIGQINQYRSNGRFGTITSGGEQWPGCSAKDLGGVSHGPHKLFEPPDCMKGNVARVWLYMAEKHGVIIPDDERIMFFQWDKADPVNIWEKIRDARIMRVQGNGNPFVTYRIAEVTGNCPWE